MPIILARHGKPDGQSVPPAEARRVGELVRDLGVAKGVSLEIVHIITSCLPRTKQTAGGIAELNGITIPPEGFPSDRRIFDCYPTDSYSTSPEIQGAMILVRDKVREIGVDIPLIVVGHLPSIWGIGSVIDPSHFPKFDRSNDGDIDKLLPYGSVVIVPQPKL